jgi:NAD(P)-dependent dehydrogenase (short-subunit alcohol dehydrogenase family)
MGYSGFDLTNKTAVVIGGTSGLGLELAKGYAQAGANVIPTGRRKELVEQACQEICKSGVKTLAYPCDVSDRESLKGLLKAATDNFGAVDILVNSAGRIKRVPTLEMADQDWNDILETNLTGTLKACQVFGKHMVDRKAGRIVNIASLNSYVALYEVAAYAASKAAVASLTRSLAIEFAKYNVCVNALVPGIFRTALNSGLLDGTPRGAELKMRTPMGRFGQLNELVGAGIFLASDSASFVTGQMLIVDGGFLASGVNQ